jgi:maltose-binding protein MalE
MRMTVRATAGILAAMSLVVAACGDDDDGASDTTSAATTPATEATTAPETAAPTTEAPDTAAPDTAAPDTSAAGDTTTTEFVPPERGDADLVIWADNTRKPILDPLAEQFGTDNGITVSVLEVPFERIRASVGTAAPAGQGPDIFVGAHDWIGELVEDGIVAPIDLGPVAGDFSEVATAAFTWTDGSLYGLPYAIENIALIRNTDLVPEAPATWDDVLAAIDELQAAGSIDFGIAVQQLDGAAPYHNYPLFTGHGGYLFAQNDDGSFDTADIGVDSEGGLAAAAAIAQWEQDGVLNSDVNYDLMISTFGEGRAPFAITGPWAISEADRGFRDAGVNYAVEPIPPIVDGATPQVFVGVQGFYVSAFSESQDLAKTFVLDFLAAEDTQLALFEAGGRPPALTSAFEQVSTDPDIAGFGAAGQNGVPLPAFPFMSSVFDTWQQAYTLLYSGTDPTQAFTDAAEQMRQATSG